MGIGTVSCPLVVMVESMVWVFIVRNRYSSKDILFIIGYYVKYSNSVDKGYQPMAAHLVF